MTKNDLTLLNEEFEGIYQDVRTYIRDNKKDFYNAYVFKQAPESSVLPFISMDMYTVPIDENLSKEERQYRITINVEIYAQDQGTYARRTIARDLQEFIFNYFTEEYGFGCIFNQPIPNLDANIHRIRLTFRATYDMDTNIIYRN